jgi:2-polyprenyl-3-methyl-5-hydroxy-6-metoxy-1,4-benzoquinol methylase
MDMAVARYDPVADFYATHFNDTDDPVSVSLLDLLGPVSGVSVLDVACGHGRISRELARRGASVLGVDLSAKLIDKAEDAERHEPLGIRYLHADVGQPGVLGTSFFDAAVCNFGLSDIDDLDAALTTVSAALRPGGRFVFSILHPCFGGGKDISGSWSPAGSYYAEGRWVAEDVRSTLRRQVGANHRTLSTYLNALRGQDLWIDRVAEPPPLTDWDPAHDADRKPVHLVVRALKRT